MLKLTGAFVLLMGVVVVCREYAKNRKRRLSICEEFSLLIAHLRLEIACYLKPLDEVVSAYESPVLEESGFLPMAREVGLSEAFLSMGSSLFLSDEERGVLGRFFSSLGSGYMEDEIKLIDLCAVQFSQLLEHNRTAMPNDVKLYNTLFCAAALGIIIFLI